MMGSIIGLLTARGLSEPLARVISYAALALLLLGACTGLIVAYNHHVIAAHQAGTIKRAAPATDQAATERANDTIANAKSEQEAHSAIHSVPDAAPAAPSHQLACERLRRRGHAPASCR